MTFATRSGAHGPPTSSDTALTVMSRSCSLRKLSQGLHHPGQLRRSWYFFFFFFFDLPDLPETVVHANHWHFFRHFLHDARPAFTPEETDR
jgi:hypothetical protein